MIGKTILHYDIIEKLGEARLRPDKGVTSGFVKNTTPDKTPWPKIFGLENQI